MELSAATEASVTSSALMTSPAPTVWTTLMTEIRFPDRFTNSIVDSAPARISSTANAARAGLRSRGAVGRRFAAAPRPAAWNPPVLLVGPADMERSLLTAPGTAYASGSLEYVTASG